MSARNADSLSNDRQVPIDIAHAKSELPLVFLFPGISGLESELSVLSDGCASELRTVPIHLPDWVRYHDDLINLDGLVSSCMAQIERHGQRGSVLLAGYSFGGYIALAVAAALHAAGRHVGGLALLDTYANPPTEEPPVSFTRPGRRLISAFRNRAVGAELARIAGALIIRIRNKNLSRFVGRLLPYRMLPNIIAQRLEVSITMSFNVPIQEEALTWIAQSNDRFRFPAVLFRCSEQSPGAPDDLGWKHHLANLRVVPVRGNHVSLTNPENSPSLCRSFVAAMNELNLQTQECLG